VKAQTLARQQPLGEPRDATATEDIKMFRGTVPHFSPIGGAADHHGTGRASAIAILFAVIAAISFAIDLTISLSGPPPATTQLNRPVR